MTMEELIHIHEHPLIPFTRFVFSRCEGCSSTDRGYASYIYGGYRCNEASCIRTGDSWCDTVVFHKECVKSLPEIDHPSHPHHSLKLMINIDIKRCRLCGGRLKVGYCCSICKFYLDLRCARIPAPLIMPNNSYGHEHPLELSYEAWSHSRTPSRHCKGCGLPIYKSWFYKCHQCEVGFHDSCIDNGPESYHACHPQHPLKLLECEEAPDYADNKCLLCAREFDDYDLPRFCHGKFFYGRLHHCGVCNLSICLRCMENPPPVFVESPTTHEHQLHLVPRRIDFTCNACGTQGDRSPYFCLQCNFMIHRECIDLPRIININRHDHRISYTHRLGHGKWKCRVCRQKVDGFYGAYSCFKCSDYVVHSRCATKNDVWDMIELEGIPEEEEIAPFEVIDDNTIRHFSHDHNLQINKDGRILHENIVCQACVFQIYSEPFYSCKECDFILHGKCANLPRKKRHVCHNQPFTLHTDSHDKNFRCHLCYQDFTGFRYESGRYLVLDVRCGSMIDSFVHESHPHPLYYSDSKPCSGCGLIGFFSCDECEFTLDYKCAILPQKVMRHRYDDHPFSLSYGESSTVDGEYYWCEACETKVNLEKWFYTCNDCGVTLHIFCVLGDLSYTMPGAGSVAFTDREVVSNTSICRPLCSRCNSRCKLTSILKVSKAGVEVYFCSSDCAGPYLLYPRDFFQSQTRLDEYLSE